MQVFRFRTLAYLMVLIGLAANTDAAGRATVTIDLNDSKPISPLLTGGSFEDLSYAADGGLYTELIENPSFDYSAADDHGWNALSFWDLEKRDGESELISDAADSIHSNNPLDLVLGVKHPGEGVGIINYGFGGINRL